MPRKAKLSYTERTRAGGFRATVRVRGKRVKGPAHFGPDARRQAHDDALRLLDSREVDPGEPVELSQAVDQVLQRMLHDEVRPGTVEHFESHIGWWLRELGEDAHLDQVTREEVQRHVDEMRKSGAAPTTIRHRLAALTRAYNICGIAPNPADRKKLILPRTKHRDPGKSLSWAEAIEMLLAVGDAGHTEEMAVLGFVLGTGIRRTEFARMRRSDLDVKGKRFVIAFGKNQPRQLPMPASSGAQVVVEGLLALNPDGEHVLPGDTERRRITYLSSCVAVARGLLGDDDRRIQLHELRRCFGSRVAEAFPVPVVSALLGHRLEGVVGRYVHADQKTLREAMASVWADFQEPED